MGTVVKVCMGLTKFLNSFAFHIYHYIICQFLTLLARYYIPLVTHVVYPSCMLLYCSTSRILADYKFTISIYFFIHI